MENQHLTVHIIYIKIENEANTYIFIKPKTLKYRIK